MAHHDEACIAVRLRSADAEQRVSDLLRTTGGHVDRTDVNGVARLELCGRLGVFA
jgi:hypothetical protein